MLPESFGRYFVITVYFLARKEVKSGMSVNNIVPIPVPFWVILFLLFLKGVFFFDMSSKLRALGLTILLIFDF